MKAISLWQPWASLIANGAKRIETRSWNTYYRGPILIHAAKRCIKSEMSQLAAEPNFCAALNIGMLGAFDHITKVLPYGALIAVVDLVDVKRTQDFHFEELYTEQYREGHGGEWCEHDLGNYSHGRYGWILDNVRPITPIPYKGEQGMFEVPESVFKAVV